MKITTFLIARICVVGIIVSNLVSAKRPSLKQITRIKTGWKKDKGEETGSGGEVRKFEIDFTHYKKCKLPHKPFFIKKYYVEGIVFNRIEFIAGLDEGILQSNDPPDEILEDHYIAHRVCAENKHTSVNWQETSNAEKVGDEGNNQPATGCGLSTILSYLCYLDREAEPSIMSSSPIGYYFEEELDKVDRDPDKKKKVENLKLHAEKSCKWILKILNTAEPSCGARAYVYGALDAGYQILLAMDLEQEDGFESFETAKLSDEFQKTENQAEMGRCPFLDKFVKKYGRSWYFCKTP